MSDSLIEIVRYNPGLKQTWNDFVESSKNGTFLFNRDYMDYHSDRFQDFSLLFYRKDKLYCLLPANISGDTLYSHQGLTYGGLVMSAKCSAQGILDVFVSLLDFLRERDIKRVVYKSVPYIYSSIPSEEDLYALFRNNASLIIRNVSSTIFRPKPLNLIKDRRAALRRAQTNNLKINDNEDFDAFWEILNLNLSYKYGVAPVHSIEEIKSLHSKFPDNIKLYTAEKEHEIVAGVLCYVSSNVVHAQYISANSLGKSIGAVDFLINHILKHEFLEIPYFDFGISNEDGGRYLNESLIYQKEGFGGRAVCYDTYEITL